MRRVIIISLVSVLCFASCATLLASERSMNESMLNFLPYLNQKVAGYLSANKQETLDDTSYREIVDKVCSPLPACHKSSESLFNKYRVSVRKLDGIFSVMLCDKDTQVKAMEDFSCNEERVEIRNFETDPDAKCDFDPDWQNKIAPYCPDGKK